MLRWTLRLRWVAVVGQLVALLIAHLVFQLVLPWWTLAGALMTTIISNHFLQDFLAEDSRRCGEVIVGLIFCDSLILTFILFFSGGTHNPFASFYLLLIALASMTLTGRSIVMMILLILIEALFLNFSYRPFIGPDWVIHNGRLTYPVFLSGWSASLIIIGGCVAFFVHRMNRQLRKREALLTEAEQQVAEAHRFQALATLAAGVAHELGSPLGTIAIASKDLERTLVRSGTAPECQEDARLIRTEVERCRQILDRLDRNSTRHVGESPQRCDAATLCDQLTHHLNPRHLARLKIDDRTNGFPLFLSIHAILQSLVVLIENACEADPSLKPVLLDIRIEEQTVIVFRIYDSGPGIPPSIQRRIGEPFFSTKRDRSGMGLGIFLVQTLTDHLGGSCSLMPSAEGGTCATLSFPVKSRQLS